MKPGLVIYAALTLFFAASTLNAKESIGQTIAFGYLTNKSNDRSFDYLETILPNTLANTLKNRYGFKILKPYQALERLKSQDKDLEKHYEPFQVQDVITALQTDYFLYGSFTPMPNNQVEIVINFYRGGENILFSFTNVGRMEAEIFKLADRIISILMNYMSEEKYYKSAPIKKGSPIGVITNVDGTDLNYIYYSFANAGYTIQAVQGNTIYNNTDYETLSKFKYIYTKRASYNTVTDRKKMSFLFGTWTGERYNQRVQNIRRIYKEYDLNYEKTKNEILNKLSKTYKFDYLLIISFNEDKTEATLRCINVKDHEMMWMQSGIKGKDLEGIVKVILDKMEVFYEVPVVK